MRTRTSLDAVGAVPCRMTEVRLGEGSRELRFNCIGDNMSAEGFLRIVGDAWQGRFDQIHIAGSPALRNHDDFAWLAHGVIACAKADHPALAAHQPFRRRPILELIATLLENPRASIHDR
jgi:hypothetical protein